MMSLQAMIMDSTYITSFDSTRKLLEIYLVLSMQSSRAPALPLDTGLTLSLAHREIVGAVLARRCKQTLFRTQQLFLPTLDPSSTTARSIKSSSHYRRATSQ